MKKITRRKLGLTASGACIAALIATLPLVSSSVEKQHEAANWHFRAQAMTSAQTMPSSSLSELGAMHLRSNGEYALQDATLIASLKPLDYSLMSTTREKAKQTQCLATAIYYEARSETLAGQKAVGEVVLNRVSSKHFPDTVCDVVYEGAERKTGCQFSFTCDGSMETIPSGKAWNRSQTIAQHLILGAHKPTTSRSTHYHTTDINPVWAANLKSTRIIGSHAFYKFKSRRENAGILAVAP